MEHKGYVGRVEFDAGLAGRKPAGKKIAKRIR